MSPNAQPGIISTPHLDGTHLNDNDHVSADTQHQQHLFKFTSSSSLSPLTVPLSTFLSSRPHIHNFMTATLVFQSQSQSQPNSSPPQVLLLRRAPTDSYPLSWELPGGSVDPTDPTILSAAARELWEETSLRASHFVSSLSLLPQDIKSSIPEPEVVNWGVLPEIDDVKEEHDQGISVITFGETGDVWGKVTLLAEVEDTRGVEVRPDEHVEWAWVSEEEVLTGWLRGKEDEDEEKRVLGLVSESVRSQILQAFRSRRETN